MKICVDSDVRMDVEQQNPTQKFLSKEKYIWSGCIQYSSSSNTENI